MAGGRRQAVVRAREVVLPWVHVWSAGMSVLAFKRALLADKVLVVTMLQKRNQVFEVKRVLCADVHGLLHPPPPRCRPRSSVPGRFCFHSRSHTHTTISLITRDSVAQPEKLTLEYIAATH